MSLDKREMLWKRLLAKLIKEERSCEKAERSLIERMKIVDRGLSQVATERSQQMPRTLEASPRKPGVARLRDLKISG